MGYEGEEPKLVFCSATGHNTDGMGIRESLGVDRL